MVSDVVKGMIGGARGWQVVSDVARGCLVVLEGVSWCQVVSNVVRGY